MIDMALVRDILIFYTFHIVNMVATTLKNLYIFVVLIGLDSIPKSSRQVWTVFSKSCISDEKSNARHFMKISSFNFTYWSRLVLRFKSTWHYNSKVSNWIDYTKTPVARWTPRISNRRGGGGGGGYLRK